MNTDKEKKNDKVVHFFVNNTPQTTEDHTLTGAQIKNLAGIPLADELFLETKKGDELVANDKKIRIHEDDRFHSMPAPQYGGQVSIEDRVGQQIQQAREALTVDVDPQPGGWTHVIVRDFPVPDAYLPGKTSILVKLPPLFPDAAPDMFWASPPLALRGGGTPQAAGIEQINGQPWQRFSWHLQPNTWRPGVSTLRDYIRVVILRLARGN